VGTAKQADAVRVVQMRARESVEVIELQAARLRAPAPPLIPERAAPTVALVDLPLDRVRDVAGRRLLRSHGGRLPWFPTDREPLVLHLLDQQVERPLEDRGQVSIANSVPEQVLSTEKATHRSSDR